MVMVYEGMAMMVIAKGIVKHQNERMNKDKFVCLQ